MSYWPLQQTPHQNPFANVKSIYVTSQLHLHIRVLNYRKRGKFHWAKLSPFRGFFEERESFSHESFAQSINMTII